MKKLIFIIFFFAFLNFTPSTLFSTPTADTNSTSPLYRVTRSRVITAMSWFPVQLIQSMSPPHLSGHFKAQRLSKYQWMLHP